MRNSTHFSNGGLGQTKPVVDPSPVRVLVPLAAPRFKPSIVSQILDRVDVTLETLTASVSSYQTSYFGTNNRHWQGILTPVAVPRDGDEHAPDLNVKPTDQTESWAQTTIGLPGTQPMSVEIHTHDGPSGKGYTVIATVRVLGEIWQRMQGVGPHSMNSPWNEVPAGL